MADRFWVGGTATWDATAGTKWATSSGGTGGASVPTNADDVYLDASSGAVTVTTSSSSVCRSFIATGFTGTLNIGSDFLVGGSTSGSFVLSSSMSITETGGTYLYFVSSVSGNTITTNGKTIPNSIRFDDSGASGAWTLQDNLTVTGSLNLIDGVLDTNNCNIDCSYIASSSSGNTRSLTLGTSTITCQNYGVDFSSTNFTFSGASSTIIINNGDFGGAGKTYGTVIFNNSTPSSIPQGHTFSQLTFNAGVNVIFFVGSTQTITNLTINGTSGSNVIFESQVPTSKYYLVVTSATCTFLDVTDSEVTGTAAPIQNVGGIDGGNNTAGSWVFSKAISVSDNITITENISRNLIFTINPLYEASGIAII